MPLSLLLLEKLSAFFFTSHESKERERSYVSIKIEDPKTKIPAFVATPINSVAFPPPAFNDMPSFWLHLLDIARYNSSSEDFVAENFKLPRNLDFVFGAGRARRHAGEPRKFSVHETPPVNFLSWRKFTFC